MHEVPRVGSSLLHDLLVLLLKPLLVLKLANQRSDVRQNLNSEFVTMFQVLFGALPHSYSSRRARDNYCTSWKCSAL